MAVPISNVTRRVVYAASGTGPYAFTFEILANTDIAVYKDDTLLTLTTDYTVTIASNGTGSITLVASPAGATQIAIVGNRTIQRTTDFVTGGDFFANTVNDEMDQQTIFAQQNAEGLQRALQAPQTDPTTINMVLPRASVRASKVLAFDASGNPSATEFIGSNRGNWTSGTLYYVRDIVKDTSNSNIYQCTTQHTASGSQPISTNADSGKWALLVDAAAAAESASDAADSATAAASSASAASTSASSASTSASAASTSASGASTSATNAASSASSASSSASTASTAATNAGNSATAAATSATSASNSASAASTSASNASSSASAASTSASNASTSATNAASSATAASGSASTASTQATNAASSATAAAGSATSAASAQTAAEAARDATLAAYDNFDDRYLGAKTSDPTVDNDGNALVAGSLYFNTVSGGMKVYTGSSWVAAYISGSGYLASANNLSDISDASAARINLGLAIGTNVQAYDADLTTWAGKTAPTGDVVGTSDTQNLSNKTLTAPTIASANLTTALTVDGAAGTSGQVLTSGGSGAAPTWASPAASAGAFTAVASGSLTTGQTVVLNTDGTVTAVSGANYSAGTAVTYNSSANNFSGAVYDPVSGKVIVAYVNGGSSYAAVGTVSGTSISFGTPASFGINSGIPYSLAYDTTNSKVVIAFSQWNGSLYASYAVVGTVSGTSISFGSSVAYQTSATTNGVSIAFIGSGTVIAFSAANASYATGLVAATISGTTITFGSTIGIGTSGYSYCGPKALAYDSVNGKFVLTYSNNGPSVYTIVGSVSGTTVTAGTASDISSITATYRSTSSTYDVSSGKTVITYGSTSSSYTAVGTISGTTLTLGTTYTLPSGGADYINPSYDSVNSRIVFVYNSGSALVFSVGYVSGTNITVSATSTTLASVQGSGYIASAFDATNSKMIATYIETSTSYNTAIVFQPETSNIRNKPFVGFSAGSYSNGNTATINSVGSTDSNQSGLTVGVAQYVQAAGGLGTSPAGSASVYAGYSLSATKILVKG